MAEPNKYAQILRAKESTQLEKLTAIYVEALKEFNFLPQKNAYHQNASNLNFLREAEKHFKSVDLPTYASRVKLKIDLYSHV